MEKELCEAEEPSWLRFEERREGRDVTEAERLGALTSDWEGSSSGASRGSAWIAASALPGGEERTGNTRAAAGGGLLGHGLPVPKRKDRGTKHCHAPSNLRMP